MEREAFKLFATLERDHWWFRGRRGLYLPLLEHVLRRAGRAEALDVLDVGCGVGGFLGPLGRFGAVLGTERDEESVRWCRARGLARTCVAECDALPVPLESHDVVCLWDVVEHVDDDVAVLREARRVLRPGGHVALSVPAYQFLYAHNDRVAHHKRRYTRGRLVGALRAAGFEVAAASYVNTVLSLGIVPAVLALKAKQSLFPPGPQDASNNLSVRIPRPLNELLAWVFASERHVLRHVPAPFGHSVFAVGRRP